MGDAALREADFVLWEATSDRTHLARAHASYVRLREQAPATYGGSLLDGVRLNRAILTAWQKSET